MTPAKKSSGRKNSPGAGNHTTGTRADDGTGGTRKKTPGKIPGGAKKTRGKTAKKATQSAKKTGSGSSKKAAKRGSEKKSTPEPAGEAAHPDESGSAEVQLIDRVRSLDSQDLIHALAGGLVRLGEGYSRARDEVAAARARARRAASTGHKRLQEAGASARDRLQHTRETTGETIATARGVSVGTLMRMEEVRDEFLVRLADGTQELAERAREAREKGNDFYARHREEILALTITAIKIAAVIGIRRLTAPRKKKQEEGDEKRDRKVDVVEIVGNLLGQVGKLLAHQPSALPLLREVYRKGDPAEQAVVGLLLAPTLHQDPEHALEVIEEFLEGASEEPAADTIARRTLVPLLRDHPELVDQVTSWMRATGPLVKRGALVALSSVLRDRHSRVGDVVSAAVIVLEDHDEEVRDAVAWFLETASDVDLEMTARTIADWAKARGADVEEVVGQLPGPLGRRVKDLAEEEGSSSWDG